MPSSPQLAGQNQSGEPVITHDPASIADLILVETVDSQKPDYTQIAYGTLYPGYVDPATGNTLYSDFQLIDFQPVDQQYVKRFYQKLPGSWLYREYVDPETSFIIFESRRKNIGANIVPNLSATPAWAGTHAYSVGSYVQPVAGGKTFVCTIAGTSSNSEPSWPSSGTITDGGVTWLFVTSSNTSQLVERQDINAYVAWEIQSALATYTNRSWNDVVSWSFPYVITSFALQALKTSDGIDTFGVYLNYTLNGGYSGPVPVTVYESWSIAAPSAESPTILFPQGGMWDFVDTRGSIPVSLHAEITINDSGPASSDPKGPAAYTSSVTFPATSPTTLPSTMILEVRTVPHKGGFLKRKTVCTAVPGA